MSVRTRKRRSWATSAGFEMKVLTPGKVYPPVGRCIYCGVENGDLRREHIVPFGLAGNLVLPQASCANCAAITGKIERACLRRILGNFRIRYGFPTRHKKERPRTLRIESPGNGGKVTLEDVPVQAYPRYIVLFRQKLPGILVNRPASNEFDPDPFIFVDPADEEKLFSRSARWGTYRNADFCLMLAKIAHAYAVADLGFVELDKYNLPLPRLILDNAEATNHYVGGQPKRDPPPDLGILHQLQVERGDLNGRQFVVVHIRLFAHFGAPLYHVVVGERPSNSSDAR